MSLFRAHQRQRNRAQTGDGSRARLVSNEGGNGEEVVEGGGGEGITEVGGEGEGEEEGEGEGAGTGTCGLRLERTVGQLATRIGAVKRRNPMERLGRVKVSF